MVTAAAVGCALLVPVKQGNNDWQGTHRPSTVGVLSIIGNRCCGVPEGLVL
jgi:hypothetical protein